MTPSPTTTIRNLSSALCQWAPRRECPALRTDLLIPDGKREDFRPITELSISQSQIETLEVPAKILSILGQDDGPPSGIYAGSETGARWCINRSASRS